MFCTAPSETARLPAVRAIASRLIAELDDVLAAKFREAQRAGLPVREARLLAKIAQGVLHSLALRARAGESRASLARMARGAAEWLAGG